uniref:NF-kappa-B inhibitor-like protein 2 n=1 Tax=Nothobranchius rachovii TaxID=451742 RepID=A0A1A8RH70_9TELE
MSSSREIKQLLKAKSKAQTSNHLKEEANICNQLGELLSRTGDYKAAIREHQQELALSEALKDVIGRAVAHRKIGECYAEMGNIEAALKHQHHHLDLARSVRDHAEEQRALATIGRTYLFCYESDQSKNSLKLAEDAFRKSLAIVDERLGEPKRCSEFIRRSVFIAERSQLLEDLYRANFNLGNIYFRNGQHSNSVRCLEQAKECSRKMKDKFAESGGLSGSAESKSALVPEDEYLADDWLEDDLLEMQPKKKRRLRMERVCSWDLPPLPERYRKACESLAVEENKRVTRLCEVQDSSSSVSVCGLSLGPASLNPLLRAFKLQLVLRTLPLHSLTHLDLSAIRRGPTDHPALEHLTKVLSQEECSLTHLSLASNGLTDSSIIVLSRCLPLCPTLVSLNLSGNPSVTSVGLQSILMSMREASRPLTHLNLQGCQVSGPWDSYALDGLSTHVQELRLCSQSLNKLNRDALKQNWVKNHPDGCFLNQNSKFLLSAADSSR